jgi:hypothetical protein
MLSFFFLEYVKTMEQERQRKYAEAEKSDNKIVGYNDTFLDEVRYISNLQLLCMSIVLFSHSSSR